MNDVHSRALAILQLMQDFLNLDIHYSVMNVFPA